MIHRNLRYIEVYKLEKGPTGLNSLKSKVDKLHIDKLVHVAVDLSKRNDAVKNDVVKKTEYDAWVKKVNAIRLLILVLVILILVNYDKRKLVKLKTKFLIMIIVTSITTQEINKLTAENFAARLK